MLMNVYYENTIDTINDMLESDRTFRVVSDTYLKDLLFSDPRIEVKQLAKKVVYYKYGTGNADENADLYQG